MQIYASFAFTMVFLLAAISTAYALPMPQHGTLDTSSSHTLTSLDERPTHRTAAVVLCILYALLLALAQGYRLGRTAGRKTKTRFSNVLVVVQGLICTAFLFVVAVSVSGLGLQTDPQCYVAVRVCIALYGSAKIALTLFLLERVHIIRAPFVKRIRDPIWLVGAALTICGYSTIMAAQFINPRAQLSRDDGICRIGIQPDAAIAVTVFDTVLNTTLTGLFVWQLLPALKSLAHRFPTLHSDHNGDRGSSWSLKYIWKPSPVLRSSSASSSKQNLKIMLIRNVIGSILLLVNVIVNNAIYIQYPFAKMGHACLLMCLTDIVLGMLVTHWLTMRSAEEIIDPAQRIRASMLSTSDASGLSTMRSRRQTLDLTTYGGDPFTQLGEKPAPVSNSKLQEDSEAIHFTLR